MKKRNQKQLTTLSVKLYNLASLMMEKYPEEYKKMIQDEASRGIITEDDQEIIYRDGKAQIRARKELHQSFLRLKDEQS